jgi:hypothetical protein
VLGRLLVMRGRVVSGREREESQGDDESAHREMNGAATRPRRASFICTNFRTS